MRNYSKQITTLLTALFLFSSSFLSAQVLNARADSAFQAWNDAYLLTKNGLTLYRAHLGNDDFDGTWTLAIDIQAAEDVYERTGLTEHKQMVANLCSDFLTKERPPYDWDGWNDDLAWMGLVLARGSQMTGISSHINVAESECFDLAFDRGWDTRFNDGGIWEEQPDYSNDGGTTLKESLSNHPNGHLAALIYQETGKQEYLDKAIQIYEWSRTHLIDPKSGQVYTGVNPDGSIKYGSSVYNYGSYIDFLVSLYQITNDEKLIRDATMAADYVVNNHVTSNGIISNTSEYLDTWAGEYARGLGHLCKERPELWKKYYPFLKKNADAAWKNRRRDLNLSWNGWDQQTPSDQGVKVTKYVSTVDLLQHTPTIQNPLLPIESDHYNYMQGVTFRNNGDLKYAEKMDKDDWLEYLVDVPANGNYTISLDVAATGAGSFGIEINHKTTEIVEVPNTGDLQTFQTVNAGVVLEKGIQSIRILTLEGGWNFDKWMATVSPAITPKVSINGGALLEIKNVSVDVGDNIILSPQVLEEGEWLWSGPNGFSATTREITITDIQTNQGGKYTTRFKNTNGLVSAQKYILSLTTCTPSEIITEIFVDDETITVDDITIEAGSYVRIKPQEAAGDWSWEGPNNFEADTREIAINSIGYKHEGEYIATFINTDGCKSSKTIKLTVIGADPCGSTITPYVNVAGWENTTNASVALGSSVQFGPQPFEGSWTWTGPDGFSANTREPGINGFNEAKQGIYTATLVNLKGCSSSVDFAISLEDCDLAGNIVPNITIGGNPWADTDTVRIESGLDLAITFPNATGSILWTAPSGQNHNSDEIILKKITSYFEGDYVINYVDLNACVGSHTIHIEVVGDDYCSDAINPWLQVNNSGWVADSKVSVTKGDRIELGPQVAGQTGGYRWTWTFMDNELQTGKNSRVLNLSNMSTSKAGIYKLVTTNSAACRSYMDFDISLKNPTAINDLQRNNTTLLAYPNPAKNSVTITGINANSKLSIIDTKGKVVINQEPSNLSGSVLVNISSLKPGIYFILLENERTKTLKLIKQ